MCTLTYYEKMSKTQADPSHVLAKFIPAVRAATIVVTLDRSVAIEIHFLPFVSRFVSRSTGWPIMADRQSFIRPIFAICMTGMGHDFRL